MGCLKIAGRVVGTTDGAPSLSVAGCHRSRSARIANGCEGMRGSRTKLGYDEVSAMSSKETMADSAQAVRILQAIGGKLNVEDTFYVVDLLKDAGRITDGEARSIKEALDPETGEREGEGIPDAAPMAADAMFPHQHRLKQGFGAVDTRGASRDDFGVRPFGHGDNAASQAEQRAWTEKTFPHRDRLK